ncbi:hypothetical protein CLAFUW4_01697 [Fulvia fulva]|uniref:SAP domain-containing protein n=1 Tax=Passalora fulva TaxID=5499 RepID=A0A9Q8L825_PASFU|nr:uncharacterized protein CLAFUR5_01694 [Fulvia fulva]KAK4634801.1 hypothetical protein CLAFUR4_01695 [Fulvia fulva]KAK4637952.1 hypothetical protein CLAFUR0_01696 [Fulvia fulva]UJO12573.1 hypothetical protein CLAFUR5_01694 [Fulvia fulva]WPV09711.1 hypothetical protein CLAFUW4_01697 [Fulvia fulva]WPV25172.1 hypothetical protein CLAFUW7_01699 [Fulvia fulva]
MVDYSKKKNDELAALCKERSLPHTGKKADLVKRLEDYDAKADSGTAAAPAKAEDEIDWDEEPAAETAKAATTEPAANAIAAGGVGEVSNPQAVPNQEAAIDPAKTDDLSVAPPEGTTEAKPTSTMPDRTIDEELEKLKKRAEKFGNPPEMLENIKKMERAKKFGVEGEPGLGMLNQALSTEKPYGKRGREGAENDGGIRKRSKVRPGKKGGGGGEAKPKKESNEKSNGGYPSWMTDKDKEAAERRKAKFSS